MPNVNVRNSVVNKRKFENVFRPARMYYQTNPVLKEMAPILKQIPPVQRRTGPVLKEMASVLRRTGSETNCPR